MLAAAALLPALLALQGFPEPTPRPANEQPPGASRSSPAPTSTGPTEVRWYGWQSLLTDALSLTLLVRSDSPTAVRVAGGAGLIAGVPVVHLANHNPGAAIASLAVRGGVVLVAAAIASSNRSSCAQDDPFCKGGQVVDEAGDVAIAAGLLLGGLVFAVVDDTVLSRVNVPIHPTPSAAPAPHARGFQLQRVSALLTPTRGGVSVGFAAGF